MWTAWMAAIGGVWITAADIGLIAYGRQSPQYGECGSTCSHQRKKENQKTPMYKILMVMALAAMAEGHSGTRLYPFYQLTDEMLEEIDLHDGAIDEWYEVGEPSMTLLDFKTFSDRPHDPSNLDFRVWLAWHDEPDRVYAAFIIADDIYRNSHNYTEDPWMDIYDSIVFQIDADHAGGRGGGDTPSREQWMEIHGAAQRYSAVARTATGPILDDGTWWEYGSGIPKSWRIYPPYGDAGGMAAGENPTISVVELYVTPFDQWGKDVGETRFSDLSAHKIVGFSAEVFEQEEDFQECRCSGVTWYPAEMEGQAWIDLYDSMADLYVDGLLLSAEETAVESMTWGRIKASLD